MDRHWLPICTAVVSGWPTRLSSTLREEVPGKTLGEAAAGLPELGRVRGASRWREAGFLGPAPVCRAPLLLGVLRKVRAGRPAGPGVNLPARPQLGGRERVDWGRPACGQQCPPRLRKAAERAACLLWGPVPTDVGSGGALAGGSELGSAAWGSRKRRETRHRPGAPWGLQRPPSSRAGGQEATYPDEDGVYEGFFKAWTSS